MKRIVSIFVLLLLTLVLMISSLPSAAESAESAIYRVYYDSTEEITPFLEFNIWQDRITDGSFLVYMTPEEYTSVADLPLRIELDAKQTATLSYVDPLDRGGGIPNYSCYRTVEETYSTLASLAAANPTLIDVVDIGDSYHKATAGGLPGYDLNAYVVTNQNSTPTYTKPVFLILAAVHAREYVTAETATRLVESLVNGYGTDPQATWLLDYYELHVIPQGNPDGRVVAETGSSWRKNRNDNFCSAGNLGIDLNRNASYQWNAGGGGASSGNSCSSLYRGPSATSEVETIAFEEYATTVLIDQRDDTLTAAAPLTTTGMFVTLHSFDESILPAWGWKKYSDNPNFEGMNAIGRKMAVFNDYVIYGTFAGFSSPADGTHDDFVYGEFGVPAYTFEMGTTFFQSCSSFENTVYPDNKLALEYAFKASRQPYQQAFGPDLVDLTLNSAVTNSITITHGDTFTLAATADDARYRYNQAPFEQAQYGINEFIDNQPISSVTLYVDQPSWESPTATYTLTATDGTFDSISEAISGAISTNGWTVGQHIVFVEATDMDGDTGIPSAFFVNISDSMTPTSINLYLPFIAKDAATMRRTIQASGILFAHIALVGATVSAVHLRGKN